MKIDLVILAAGFSRRFPGNKLLHPIHGKAMIQHVVEAASPVGFHHMYVVSQYQEVITRLQAYPITCIYNQHPEKGMSHSIQLALTNRKEAGDATMFLSGDLPFIQTQTLQHLCEQADESHIICATNQGIMMNPMIFPKVYECALFDLREDVGGKKIALRHLEDCVMIDVDAREIQDIDTMEDIERTV